MSSPLDTYSLRLLAPLDPSSGVDVRYHAPTYGDTLRAIRWAQGKPEGFEEGEDYLYPLGLLGLCVESLDGLTRQGHPLSWPALPDLSGRVRLLEQLPPVWVRRLNTALGEVGDLAPEEERPTFDSSP